VLEELIWFDVWRDRYWIGRGRSYRRKMNDCHVSPLVILIIEKN